MDEELLYFQIPKIYKPTHNGIIAGKLKGVIPAQTPKGILYELKSMSLAIPDKDSPSWSEGALQQCSTTSEIDYMILLPLFISN